jgi:hypothetical protein
VALLEEHAIESRWLLSRTPRLRALSTSLRRRIAPPSESNRSIRDYEVTASQPLQTSIELAVSDGRITATTLLLGLLKEPRTHLLRLIAEELEVATSRK